MKYFLFLKDIKKFGIKYAMLMKLWLIFGDFNKNFKRRKITKLQDKIEILLDEYDNHMQQQEPPEPEFESNCINYWSCDCCPSRGSCNEL